MKQRELNAKAARMLHRYAQAEFASPQASQRLRARLLWWVIRNKAKQNVKRVSDVLISSVMLLMTAPIMAITALAIKLDSPGPVLYTQTRIGKWGKPFKFYKFRSMFVDADARKSALMAKNDADGPVFKMKDDPRVTRVGRIIRKFSIDELPQLYNVWRGDMSLVGPRPAVPDEVAAYAFDERNRLEAMPGLTGLQQISGRSDLDFQRWIELDLTYISEQSLWTDLKILIKTIPAVISGDGAY